MHIRPHRLVPVVTFAALLGGLSLAAAPPTVGAERDLGSADARLLGDVAGARAGFDVTVVGDLDGDGATDLAVGAPFGDHGNGPSAGAVHIVYGPVRGTIALSGTATIVGTEDGDFVGEDVGGIGDLDGDGFDDLLVGAPGSIPGFQPGPPKPGTGYVFYGGRERLQGTVTLAEAEAALVGVHPSDFAGFGAPPAPVGDLNGDGVADLVIGSAGWAGETGTVYVLYGEEDQRLEGMVPLSGADVQFVGIPGDFAGFQVAGVGDLDADGMGDLVIGAPGDASSPAVTGSAYVVYGDRQRSGTIPLTDADARLVGELPGDRAGIGVADVGDVDGDGLDDLLVGASARSFADVGWTGSAYLVYGARDRLSGVISLADADVKFVGEGPNDQAGRAVAGGGDVNGDGRPDLMIGAPFRDAPTGPDVGGAYVFLGGPRRSGVVGLASADLRLVGAAETDRAGSGLAIGDVNRDRLADLIVGAQYTDAGAVDSGAVYVIYGRRDRGAAATAALRGVAP